MRKFILSGYVILLHVALAAALLRPDLVMAQHWRLGLPDRQQAIYADRLQVHYAARDRALANPRVAFIGDSHVQFMDTNLLKAGVIGYGIGGDRLRQIPDRMARYPALQNTDTIVLWAGYNDLKAADGDAAITAFRAVRAGLASAQSLVVIAVPPAAPDYAEKIAEFNMRLAKECSDKCRYLDVHGALSDARGALHASFDSGDGLHLNAQGYALVADAINMVLAPETTT